jgi:hypothetical protein
MKMLNNVLHNLVEFTEDTHGVISMNARNEIRALTDIDLVFF